MAFVGGINCKAGDYQHQQVEQEGPVRQKPWPIHLKIVGYNIIGKLIANLGPYSENIFAKAEIFILGYSLWILVTPSVTVSFQFVLVVDIQVFIVVWH